MEMPPIIQGGMGVAVSGWPLASAVSREGQFGVVSGTALAVALAHRLQRGDLGGEYRSALAAFPSQDLAQRILTRWYVPDGKAAGATAANPRLPSWPVQQEELELTMASVFAEVYLAKQHGGSGPIGVNLLTKIELLTLPSLYGAMLAGVDAVFMGAGIPRMIPGVLDAFARGETATLPLSTNGSETVLMQLDPAKVLGKPAPKLLRPAFFPIVSSEVLANALLRKGNGTVDGFVIEDHTAGGHNAPPRGRAPAGAKLVWNERDRVSLGAFAKLGLPFYLAGGQDDSMALRAAQAQGATGIQIGTAFAFCAESGLRPDLKAAAIKAAMSDEADITTDALASPTGFPFKVVQLAGTLSEERVYADRERSCELGYLRTAYRRGDGTLGWRCPAEREEAYLSKGGQPEDLIGRRCLCAGLMAAAGYGDPSEAAVVTAGFALRRIPQLLRPGQMTYSAADVIRYVIGTTGTLDVVNAFLGRH